MGHTLAHAEGNYRGNGIYIDTMYKHSLQWQAAALSSYCVLQTAAAATLSSTDVTRRMRSSAERAPSWQREGTRQKSREKEQVNLGSEIPHEHVMFYIQGTDAGVGHM